MTRVERTIAAVTVATAVLLGGVAVAVAASNPTIGGGMSESPPLAAGTVNGNKGVSGSGTSQSPPL